ncbi:MAG: hypothetical protein L6R35_001364 [Caloplaca aegaea]|nr:MAG: hypothetical protein L6R35_001364 [Caloplaca aegaea]
MSISAIDSGIVPATLAFLAIYNPSLSQNDDTVEDQIVYYFSKSEPHRSRHPSSQKQQDNDREYGNEKLRQIGLAQGMVEFAKTFSDLDAVNSVETEKSRIIVYQLEAGWWLLASIDLTRISSPPSPKANTKLSQDTSDALVEYSAREVSPPALLLEQALQAHQIFLLHHAQTLTELFSRLPRSKFCAILKRFWDDCIRKWDVLLHGNPAVDIYGGLKLAAGGELGIGVGEEEWGSGEREVLEGFVARTDGLVDLFVSRFGEAASIMDSAPGPILTAKSSPWLQEDDWHLGQDPRPSDGVIFSGIGALTKPSVKHISNWVVSLFKHGQDAYGIRENPVAVNRWPWRRSRGSTLGTNTSHTRLKKAQQPAQMSASRSMPTPNADFGIPAPVISPAAAAYTQPQRKAFGASGRDAAGKKEQTEPATVHGEFSLGTETLMKFMTFGLYGSKSGMSSTDPSKHQSSSEQTEGKKGERNHPPSNRQRISPGYFLVGLQGDLDDEDDEGDAGPEYDWATRRDETLEKRATSSRLILRTLVVERTGKAARGATSFSSTNSGPAADIAHERLRVLVYVKRPFIFTFLFDLETDSLSIPSFYRSLHHQLGPLQQPLLNSTSPTKVSERVSEASLPKSTVTTPSSQPIYDLVHDPYNQTVHTTIPNIPDPGSPPVQTPGSPSWTRVEARPSELERTCETNRGWWVVWMRLPHVAASQRLNRMVYREAFLIRKASDHGAPLAKPSGGVWGRNTGASAVWVPGKVAEGMGIDARQYIEGLVSLNR